MSPRRTIVPTILAIASGASAVSVDLHNSEVQAAVLVIVVGGFLLGAIWPDRAWRWALILGLSVCIGDTMAPRLHLIGREVGPVNWGTLVALIPAVMGTYIGVGVRAMLRAGITRVM